jgi:hypothetical protein
MAISHDLQAQYLAAQATLNHIHARAVEASRESQYYGQALNHHFLTAKFHLKEMENAQRVGLEDHHELAHSAFQTQLTEAGKYLSRLGTDAGDNLSGDADQLHLDSYALDFKH